MPSDKTGQPRKRARQAVFLAAMVQTGGNILKAAQLAGIERSLHYLWLEKDPKYPELFQKAWDKAIDTLEAEASRRAFEGVVEPVYHAGRRALDLATNDAGEVRRNPDGTPVAVPAGVRKYSDTLLMFLLNGNRSAKYRNRTDARFVDDKGKDRKLDLAAVHAYCNSIPDDEA
jgi:hypothetical protein